MDNTFSFHQFANRFSTDEICLEEIKRFRYPAGIRCENCRKITKHYRLQTRTAYSCKVCRHQVFPLANTIFAKTTTPLRLWFYCFFLMTQTRGKIPTIQLQRELGVTYKTAWRMSTSIKRLMQQNNDDFLIETDEKVRKWTFFNKIEITLVEKNESSS